MDLSILDIAGPSEEGRKMFLTHPRTGDPWRDSAGNALYIMLLGQHSSTVQGATEMLAARLEGRPPGSPIRTRADRVRDDAEILVAATRFWNFETLDGGPFPCTPENALRFWTDERFAWVRIKALRFISDDGAFLAPPPPQQGNGPSEASS